MTFSGTREGAAKIFIKWRVKAPRRRVPLADIERVPGATGADSPPARCLVRASMAGRFPDAFQGTMGELLNSHREPPAHISGRENLGTMALVDACYRSLDEHRPVCIQDIVNGGQA